MGLVMYWYDFVCVGIIAMAALGAIVMLIRNEGGGIRSCGLPCAGKGDVPTYESLLVPSFEDESDREEENERMKGYVCWDELWMSCWKPIHPAWLLLFRVVAFSIMVCLLAWDIKCWTMSIYVYYTEWTFTLVIIYFGLAALISAKGCSELSQKGSRRDADERANFLKMDPQEGMYAAERPGENINRGAIKLQSCQELDENRKRAGCWGYTMQVLFQTCAGAVMLTDIVFWFIIVPFLTTKDFSLNLLMGSMHSINVLLLLIDTVFNSMHFPWFRGAYFVLWSALYIVFQWIVHACGFKWNILCWFDWNILFLVDRIFSGPLIGLLSLL